MKRKFKILDCTLRDGGYVIDWNFKNKNIQSIMNNLVQAKIDFIECGFLKNCNYISDKTFFSSIEDLKKLIFSDKTYTLMINFGEYEIENFSACEDKNIKIRVAFKKHQQAEALEYIEKLVNLGWDVFANPMSSSTYSKDELENLILKINDITPYGITIVDTLGNMYENQVIDIFQFIDNILNKEIALGFHSHNSMQLSFSNTKALLSLNFDREIIIDSCLYGMGRGAGNLCTELITKYLNDNLQTDYKISQLLRTIDNILKPIYDKKTWGYSTLYYIAAIHGCHPNYATYLGEKSLSNEEIERIMSLIPQEKRTVFDKDFIKTLA